jgi:hypothetical protein
MKMLGCWHRALQALIGTFSCWECEIDRVEETLRSLFEHGLGSLYERERMDVNELSRGKIASYLEA